MMSRQPRCGARRRKRCARNFRSKHALKRRSISAGVFFFSFHTAGGSLRSVPSLRHPGYRYQPVFRRTDIIRRRVRKDVAEDEKVEAVAEALIKGKAKGELEKEIKGQMSQRSEASESDAEGSSSRGGSRRQINPDYLG